MYIDENEPFPSERSILDLPLEMIYELIKKYTDPDYEMDLTSIQNRYITDGRAVASEDGTRIEFIHPERRGNWVINRNDEE